MAKTLEEEDYQEDEGLHATELQEKVRRFRTHSIQGWIINLLLQNQEHRNRRSTRSRRMNITSRRRSRRSRPELQKRTSSRTLRFLNKLTEIDMLKVPRGPDVPQRFCALSDPPSAPGCLHRSEQLYTFIFTVGVQP